MLQQNMQAGHGYSERAVGNVLLRRFLENRLQLSTSYRELHELRVCLNAWRISSNVSGADSRNTNGKLD